MGVLVAISIPIFTAQLEKSRESTDLANLRAAKAAAVTAYLTEDAVLFDTNSTTGAKTLKTGNLYYNAGKGVIDGTGDAIGKGTGTDGGCGSFTFGNYTYTGTSNVSGQKIKVSVDNSGNVTCEFAS